MKTKSTSSPRPKTGIRQHLFSQFRLIGPVGSTWDLSVSVLGQFAELGTAQLLLLLPQAKVKSTSSPRPKTGV